MAYTRCTQMKYRFIFPKMNTEIKPVDMTNIRYELRRIGNVFILDILTHTATKPTSVKILTRV